MALPDVSSLVSTCKDHLHAEWANFKKSGIANISLVCIYAVGGQKDLPAACLESICQGFIELENVLRSTFDLSVDKDTPIISQDVMVGADGHITLYPERKTKLQDSLQVQANEVKPLPVPGQRPTKPPTPENAFMGGIEQVTNYMLDHLKRVSESCLLAGNMKILYAVLSSAQLVKVRGLAYKQILKTPTSKGLTSAINRSNETIDLMTQHLLNYQSDIIRSCILHDVSSHDWNNEKPYEENELVSLSIRMWTFHMQATRNDLWRYTSPKIAENMFNSILADTLSLLVTRYTQIEASDMRLPLMKGDIITIMLVALSFLPSLASSPRYFFVGKMHESLVFSIHRRMDLLLRIAAVKCAPIETVSNAFIHGIHASAHTSVNSKEATNIVSCPDWMTFFNSSLFPANSKQLSGLPDAIAIYLTLWNASLRPSPDHSLIVRGLAMRDFLGARTILHGIQDLPSHVEKGVPCGGALCLPHLCESPLIPHSVYSAIIQILMSCCPSSQILNNVMQNGVKESGNWESLGRTQVWNIQRPPWHHALVQMIGMHVAAVVAQVLLSVPSQPPAKPAHPSQLSVRLEHHLSAWTLQLITGMENMADNIPLCIVQIAHTINSVIPPTIKPVGGHVISQLIISAIYSIVNSRQSLDQLAPNGPITDGQWDMMVAVGERLCALHDGNYDAALAQMTKALLNQLSVVDEEDNLELDEYTDEEVIETVSQQMADMVLSTVQGQHSFGILWEYLKRNMEWIRHNLNAPPLLTPPPSAEPSRFIPRMSFAKTPEMYNPLFYYSRVVSIHLNQDNLLKFEGDWGQVLKGDLWMPTDMIKELIKKRPELRPDAILTPSQLSAVKKLKPLLRKTSVKIR